MPTFKIEFIAAPLQFMKAQMKLSKDIRSATVNAIMLDFPKIDYSTMFEEAVKKDVIKVLPKVVADIYEDPKMRFYVVGHRTESAPYVNASDCVHYTKGIVSVAVPNGYYPSDAGKNEFAHIATLDQEQQKSLHEAKMMVQAALLACQTTQMVIARHPQFEKYLPKEAEKTDNLPACINLAENLAKLGWPKGSVGAAA